MSFEVKNLPRTTDYQNLNNAGLSAINHQNGYHVQIPTQVQALQVQNLGLGAVQGVPEDPQRWTQYQHLWRQHVYNNINGNNKPAHGGGGGAGGGNGANGGHGGGIKELGGAGGGVLSAGPPDDKTKDDNELWCNVEAQTAFLGPNLWDKTYETDLKYVDLDEFLSENGVSMDGTLGSNGAGGGGGAGGGIPGGGLGHQLPKRERSPSPSDCMSPDTVNPPSPADSSLSMGSNDRNFDPRTRVFSDEELKPQPMIKKSRKQFVPDNLKDDKYWARRRKNNMAAKRSRDARRMKENQIALRAGYLEKENMGLRQELERLKKENLILLDKLSKCAEV